jgi:OmcA/MtrC family decaheme c-type cytochrome
MVSRYLLAALISAGAAAAQSGVVFELLKAEGAAGQPPTVVFTLKDTAGIPILPSELDALRLTVAGPTSDYTRDFSDSKKENARPLAGAPAGTYVWQLATPLPEGATGSYSVGITGRRGTDQGANKVLTFSVDSSPVKPRRTVVSIDKCDKCHGTLASGSSNRIEVCVLCHHANATDRRSRPQNEGPAESIVFSQMVHRIHTGKSLKQPYTLWSSGGAHQFNGLAYPGDRRDCEACHTGGSQHLPLAAGLLNVAAPRSSINPMPPATAACLGCHDGPAAAKHAAQHIKGDVENCARCHGKNSPRSVARSHARKPATP